MWIRKYSNLRFCFFFNIEDDDPEDVSLPDPESNTQYQCPDLAGVYPDTQYCHKYIRCWYGSGELYVCPKGKLYDEDLQRCRSKNSVYCYDKINPYGKKQWLNLYWIYSQC